MTATTTEETTQAQASPPVLFREVTLVFDDDSKRAGSGMGVLPKGTVDPDSGFDPNWSGEMIFHDVLEHWHEHEDPFFRDKFAMNVGGEMTAVGAMFYFYDVMNCYPRLGNRLERWTPADITINTTFSEVEQAVADGYCNFGYKLNCGVPRQLPADEEMEAVLEEYWARFKQLKIGGRYPGDRRLRHVRDQLRSARAYHNSVKKWKIFDLHRYGWHQAKKDFPPTCRNCVKIEEFLQFWTKFCTREPADELGMYYHHIIFSLYHEGPKKEMFTWTAKFVSHDRAIRENFIINSQDEENYKLPEVTIPE